MTIRYILQDFPIQEFVLIPSKCPFVNSRSYLNSSPVRTNPATSHLILQIQPILTSLTEALDNHVVMTTAFSTPLGIIVSSHGYAGLHHLWYRVQSLCLSADTQNCRYKSNMAESGMSWPWHILKPFMLLLYGKLLYAFGTRCRGVVQLFQLWLQVLTQSSVAISYDCCHFTILYFQKGMNPECKSVVTQYSEGFWVAR
jgi:hypothetical protein